MSVLTPLVVDLGISQIPHAVFTVIHLAILAVAIVLAVRTSRSDAPSAVLWAFVLVAIGEVSYIGYHVGWTTFLLSHTISEVLVLVAVVLFFSGLTKSR